MPAPAAFPPPAATADTLAPQTKQQGDEASSSSSAPFEDLLEQARLKPGEARKQDATDSSASVRAAQKTQKPSQTDSESEPQTPQHNQPPENPQLVPSPPSLMIELDAGDENVEPNEAVVSLSFSLDAATDAPPQTPIQLPSIGEATQSPTSFERTAAAEASKASVAEFQATPAGAEAISGTVPDETREEAAPPALVQQSAVVSKVSAPGAELAGVDDDQPLTSIRAVNSTASGVDAKNATSESLSPAPSAGEGESSQPQLGSNAREHAPESKDRVLAQAVAANSTPVEESAPPHGKSSSAAPAVSAIDPLAADAAKPAPTPNASSPTHPSAPSTPREFEFAQANHDRLVTAIRTQLLPRGGTMQIRLDPPQLGPLEVAVHLRDGVMSVAFQTSSEEATRLLSHSLAQLKHVLESQGVSVEKLHVQQASRGEPSRGSSDPDSQQRENLQDDTSARQEQQRKEMLRRMWRRLALGNDPLDLVA